MEATDKVDIEEIVDNEEILVIVQANENKSDSPSNEVEQKDVPLEESNITKNEISNPPQDLLSVVYATAVLDNSPHGQVTNKNIESISQIIDSKEHLQRNIEDFRFGNISSWELGNRKYMHQIQVILKVKTAQLWEGPRSYLWRHLGSSTWTLHDGTEASLIRIHQK
jgi:hypothetical protein